MRTKQKDHSLLYAVITVGILAAAFWFFFAGGKEMLMGG